MIKKINTIKNFGVFNDFHWSQDLELKEFNERNIIYGWNYTGKTTLSKIFSSLRDCEINRSFSEGEFNLIVGEDSKEITHNNMEQLDFSVQVFNSEYIQDNLKWDTDEELDGIEFDVGENVEIRQQINENNALIERIDERIKDFQPPIDEFSQFEENLFSRESRRIRNDILNNSIEFNKRHFKRLIGEIGSDYSSYILNSSELQETQKNSIAINNKGRINTIEYNVKIKVLSEEIESLLLTEPEPSKVIDILEQNNELYDWAKKGYIMHEKEELEECSFCGNNLSKSRLEELNNYYSNASGLLRDQINEYKKAISKEQESIENIGMPKSKNDFIDNCQKSFQESLLQFEAIKQKYKEILEELVRELERKEYGNIFNSIKINLTPHSIEEGIEGSIQSINDLINKHNEFVNNFNDEQQQAREKLVKHHVAYFIINNKYYEKETKNNYSLKRIERYQKLKGKISSKNIECEAKLKSVVAGREELNKYIKMFLNSDSITINVTGSDKFVLYREDRIAKNLSEGEKTAISFAYFLVVLESLHRDQKLRNTVVFIDDPISSLDANHVAQVYHLIDDFFFRKKENPDNPEEYAHCCKQLFISTHNFEFFSFLKDSKRLNKRGKREFFFIKKISSEVSRIQSMPSSLVHHKSEYIYLFSIIYKYYDEGCQENDSNLILLPNAIRRFLEIYTLIKLPGSKTEVDGRLKEISAGSHQLKVLHHFSHFTSFEKLMKHDELLTNLPKVVEELIELLKEDEKHFESLKQVVD